MAETAKHPKLTDNQIYYLRIIGTLFAITAIVALILSAVNLVTRPIIDRLAAETKQAAMAQVMPDAAFTPVDLLPDGLEGITEMQLARSESGIKGYCVQVTSNGFGGALELMVGVDVNGAVTGVSILSHSETAGTGSHPWLVEQFVGRSGTIGVSKTAGDDANIQAISGATVTSKGVTDGVNRALAAVSAYMEGGSN